jgi:hypothetical protein
MAPRTLAELADECRRVVLEAVADLGPDFGGAGSALDLCADRIDDARLSDLREALRHADLDDVVSTRVFRLIHGAQEAR